MSGNSGTSWIYGGAARGLSLALACGLSGLILFLPTVVFGGQGELNHNLLMLIMWGVAAGFVHGVGFVPRTPLLRLALGPYAAWILMAGGGLWLWLE
ncbi:MAG: Cyd operon protein YbgE [Gammaproteobacteria bacterium]|nr:Cyd operon protein YbgE [Gammaproteobacteria bacterium]